MTPEERFLEALKSNVGKSKGTFSNVFQATVVTVGTSTCKVKTTDNDLELEDVLFTATEENENGFILVPKKNTNVLVGLIGDDENSLYLVAIDELDQVKIKTGDTELIIDSNGVIINGGNNGGLIIIQSLVTAMNGLIGEVNQLKQSMLTWVPVPQDGGSSLKAATTSWTASQILNYVVADFENNKVKH